MRTATLVMLALLAWPTQPLDDAARAVAQGARRPWLEPVMRAASDDARPLLGVAAVAGLVAGGAARLAVGEAVVALVPVNLAVEGLKRLTDRSRPDGSRHRANAAFPSSHSANAFAVAVVLARRWRRGTAAWFGLALLVAASRLYLDRHWLSDVVAGAVLGATLAWSCLAALERWRARSEPPSPARAG